jgi:hypothetical protein
VLILSHTALWSNSLIICFTAKSAKSAKKNQRRLVCLFERTSSFDRLRTAFEEAEKTKRKPLRLKRGFQRKDARMQRREGADFLTTVLAGDIMQPIVNVDPLPPYPVGR